MTGVLAMLPGKPKPPGGCEIYRINVPFQYLGDHGWTTRWDFTENLMNERYRKGMRFWGDLAHQFQILVLPRVFSMDAVQSSFIVELLKSLPEIGITPVYEVDDDYTNKWRKVIDGDAMSVASACRAVTVTTPILADLMEKETSRKTYVLPNCIAPEVWQRPVRRIIPPLTIGLTGSPSHKDDWAVLETVLPRILEKHEEVNLLIMGYHPEYLADLPRTIYQNAVGYVNYASIIKACDIILAPVNDDPFNLGKSPLKIIEGMGAYRLVNGQMGGAACIASDHPIYRLVGEKGKTHLLAEHTPEGWFSAIEQVIVDQKLRSQLQLNGYDWVWKHHNITRTWALWDRAYKDILKGK